MDIRSVEPDLTIPKLETGQPDIGKRVKQTIPDYEQTDVYHVTYLPTDWVLSLIHISEPTRPERIAVGVLWV